MRKALLYASLFVANSSTCRAYKIVGAALAFAAFIDLYHARQSVGRHSLVLLPDWAADPWASL